MSLPPGPREHVWERGRHRPATNPRVACRLSSVGVKFANELQGQAPDFLTNPGNVFSSPVGFTEHREWVTSQHPRTQHPQWLENHSSVPCEDLCSETQHGPGSAPALRASLQSGESHQLPTLLTLTATACKVCVGGGPKLRWVFVAQAVPPHPRQEPKAPTSPEKAVAGHASPGGSPGEEAW